MTARYSIAVVDEVTGRRFAVKPDQVSFPRHEAERLANDLNRETQIFGYIVKVGETSPGGMWP